MDENPYKAPVSKNHENGKPSVKPGSVWSQPVPWISLAVMGVCFVLVKILVAYVAADKVSHNVSTMIGAAVGAAVARLTCKDWPGRRPPA
jgi:hypothetical protein